MGIDNLSAENLIDYTRPIVNNLEFNSVADEV